MVRRAFFLGLMMATLITTGCDSNGDDTDAGMPETDSGSGMTTPDSGSGGGMTTPDSGSMTTPDAGNMMTERCTTGCDWVELALGSQHSCVRRENGEVYCWGRGREYQLGDGRNTGHNRSSMQCPEEGGTGRPADCSLQPVRVSDIANAAQITAAGGSINSNNTDGHTTCALRDGAISCWGYQVIGTVSGGVAEPNRTAFTDMTLTGVTDVSVNYSRMCAVTSTGGLSCFGFNASGQLGSGDKDTKYEFAWTPVVSPDGTGMLGDIVDVELAHFGPTTCAVNTAGNVYCWGRNNNGSLGDGADATRSVMDGGGCTSDSRPYDCSDRPVLVGGAASPLTGATQLAVGGSHACALINDGTIQCWGDNRRGQVGLGSSDAEVRLPQAVPGITNAVEVRAGGQTTCARLMDGTIQCWGFDNPRSASSTGTPGVLGNGGMSLETCGGGSSTLSAVDCSRSPVVVTGISNARSLSMGDEHACAILDDNSIQCWGWNRFGELGNGNLESTSVPVAVNGLPE